MEYQRRITLVSSSEKTNSSDKKFTEHRFFECAPLVLELTTIANLRNLYPIKISRIRELEILELMRKRDFATYVALWNGRDWQERKRHFSNSYKFKNL